MRVLGVDPGTRATGYGLLEGERVLSWGVIRPGRRPLPATLLTIFETLSQVIAEFAPSVVALEEVVPDRFPRSALKLGQAQGAAILAAARAGLEVRIYHPLEVKKALTGYGNASKEQVSYVVRSLLNLGEEVPLDASDALSVALYHLQASRFRAKLG